MRLHKLSRQALFTFVAVLAFLATNTFAQTSRGALTGTVTDSAHAIVPNATVEITQQGTGTLRQTTTNSVGIYRFVAVDLGTYRVSVQAKGLATEDTTSVQVSSPQPAHLVL